MQVVVWGSNAYLVQADIDMIKQVFKIDFNISSAMLDGTYLLSILQAISKFLMKISQQLHPHVHMVQVEDVSNWSARMRQPMEAVYGVEGFPKLWFGTGNN